MISCQWIGFYARLAVRDYARRSGCPGNPRGDPPRPFRVPGYPVVPVIYLVVTVFVAGSAVTQWAGPSMCSLGTILAGVPVYHVWARLKHGRTS